MSLMLETNNLEKTKQLILDKLEDKKVPIDGWVHNLLNRIQGNCSLVIFCPSCKDIGYFNMSTQDGWTIATCDTCGMLYNHLEDMERNGLYSIVHYNIMMHQREKVNEK